jgi:hypothetical protein
MNGSSHSLVLLISLATGRDQRAQYETAEWKEFIVAGHLPLAGNALAS